MKRHLKRIAAPKSWAIKRKKTKFLIRPNPSGHPMGLSIPLSIFLKDMTKYAKTTKDVKNILTNKEVFVDGKRRKDRKFSVGFMDVVKLPDAKENYRVLLNTRGKLFVQQIDDTEAQTKLCKIIGKTLLKKAKMQVNLNDGKNILIKEGNYKVGDSIVLNLKDYTVKEHFPIEKGVIAFLISGKNIGKTGHIEEVKEEGYMFKDQDNNQYPVMKSSVFVIGKDKAAIKLEN
jgi:small subunit ribosomal protein S4e